MCLNSKNKYRNHERFVSSTYYFKVFVTLVFVVLQIYYLNIATATSCQKDDDQEELKPLSSEEISQIWMNIKMAAIKDPGKEKEGSIESWANVLIVGFNELEKIVMSSNPRQGLDYYVNQFAKYGSQADMRWLLAARSRLLPADRRVLPHRKDNNGELHIAEKYFAEFQVRQFLKKPQTLKRYYHSVIWFNDMFDELSFPVRLGNLHRNMKEGSKNDNYWWYAQNFVLLAHATGRDDLLKDVEPEDLKPRFQQWFEWFRKNGMYLRASPDSYYWVLDKGEKSRKEGYVPFMLKQTLPPLKKRPKYPFPDWEGPNPTTPENYRSME